MYNLRKAESGHQVLQDFVKNLPYKPYSSDDLSFGLKISSSQRALKRAYIQSNPRDMVYRITIDVDHDNAVFAAYDANIVEPTFIVKNKYKNYGRAHLHYDLKVPVCRSDNANRHPIQYLASIEAALIKALDGDPGYVGLVTKNPLSSEYECLVGEGKSYTLEELAECLELEQVQSKWRKKKREESRGYLGRNCDVFDDLRFWAYDRVSDARDSQSYAIWFDRVAEEADNLNKHQVPMLDDRELKAIAKSVARWTWDKYTGQGSGCKRGRDALKNSLLTDNKDKQVLSAIETNKQRKKNTDDAIAKAITYLKEKETKITQKAVAMASGLGIATIKRKWSGIKVPHLARVKKVSYGVHQDNSPEGGLLSISCNRDIDLSIRSGNAAVDKDRDENIKAVDSNSTCIVNERIKSICSKYTSDNSSKAYKKAVSVAVKASASSNRYSFHLMCDSAFNILIRNQIESILKKIIYPMRINERDSITISEIEKRSGLNYSEFKEFWQVFEDSLSLRSDAVLQILDSLKNVFPDASDDVLEKLLHDTMFSQIDFKIRKMVSDGACREDITYIALAGAIFFPLVEIKPILDQINLDDYFDSVTES